MGSEIQKAGGVPEGQVTHALKQNKGEHIKFEAGTDILTQGRSPAQAVWGSYLLVRSVPEPRPILMQLSGCWKAARMRPPLPIYPKILLDLFYLPTSNAQQNSDRYRMRALSLWALLFIALHWKRQHWSLESWRRVLRQNCTGPLHENIFPVGCSENYVDKYCVWYQCLTQSQGQHMTFMEVVSIKD